MRSIIVDAGPLIALFLEKDVHHDRAVAWSKRTSARLVTTWPVICEACFFLSGAGKRSLFEFIQRGAIEVFGLTVADLSRMSELVTKYPDMDFADGTLVLLAEKAGIVEIATVDTRDFAVYRTKDRRAFVNVFE